MQARRAQGKMIRAQTAIGKGAGEGGTQNMACILVTREVSQLEMSSLNQFKLKKSLLMSVTRETHQSAIAPYFAVAAAAFESYSVAAVFSEALSAKM